MAASIPAAQLVAPLQSLQYSTFVDTCAFTILIYDYLITFDDERNLMWPMSFKSPAKLLYFVTRYLPFVDTSITIAQHFQFGLTAGDCTLGIKLVGWFLSIGLMFSEVILTYRTWAIWERNRKLGIGLIIFFVIAWAPQLVITAIFLNSVVYTTLPPELPGCLAIEGSAINFVDWVLLMVYEAVILTLMVVKAVQTYREHGRSSIYKIVYTNGSVFYLYLFVLSTLNIVFILTLPDGMSQILSNFERVIHSVLTARILVSLRSLAPELHVPDNLHLSISSNVDFAEMGTVSTFEAKSPGSDVTSISTGRKYSV